MEIAGENEEEDQVIHSCFKQNGEESLILYTEQKKKHTFTIYMYMYRTLKKHREFRFLKQSVYLVLQLTIMKGGPKHIKCSEDEDFMTAFDKMMTENIQVGLMYIM